jgi:hypothetical protein
MIAFNNGHTCTSKKKLNIFSFSIVAGSLHCEPERPYMPTTHEPYSSVQLRERDKILIERHQKELAAIESKVDKLKWSNTDLLMQLFESQNRAHRLATSLGFNDIYEAQVHIHNADHSTVYKDCINGFDQLQNELAKEKNENANMREEFKRVQEERDRAKASALAVEKSNAVNR